MAATELFAPAKLTLSLRITGSADDGFHLIDAEMVALDVGDRLWVDELPAGPTAVEVVGSDLGPGGDRLVSAALATVGRHARVRVEKQIPPGAGLGGGSADAAAILRWAGWTGRGPATRRELDGAVALGADVAFCLVGGRARVRGIGELVEPLPYAARTFTLCTPPFGCPTPAVYAAWDRLGGPEGENGNDLEPAALAVEPRLAEWRDRLGDATGAVPRLAGSGSTWFVDGDHPTAAALGPSVVVARTVPAGWQPDT